MGKYNQMTHSQLFMVHAFLTKHRDRLKTLTRGEACEIITKEMGFLVNEKNLISINRNAGLGLEFKRQKGLRGNGGEAPTFHWASHKDGLGIVSHAHMIELLYHSLRDLAISLGAANIQNELYKVLPPEDTLQPSGRLL